MKNAVLAFAIILMAHFEGILTVSFKMINSVR